MSGIFIGVGTGPGDKGLITVKAIEMIRSADIVIAPVKSRESSSRALIVAKEYIEEQSLIEKMVFPMKRDVEILKKQWSDNADQIASYLNRGCRVVFLTIGDPMLYSTCWYVLRDIKAMGYTTEVVPGVTSFSASAAVCQQPLAMGDEIFTVFPVDKNMDTQLDSAGNYAFLKVSSDFEGLKKSLKKAGLLSGSTLVSNCGNEEESVVENIEETTREDVPYLSLVLSRGGKE